MPFQGKRVLAVVPARGGSKGIPRKNLCQLDGLSLVGHAARTADRLPWLDRAVLSTDDEEIAAEGRRAGLKVPFMRPDELAGDMAGSIEMWQHAWLASEAHFTEKYDLSILLEPTSPMRRPEDITAVVDTLMKSGCAAAATVSRAPAHFTPHKCLTVDEEGTIGFYHDQGQRFAIRQKIPAYYFRNGICYAVRRKTLLEDAHIIEDDCRAVVIDRQIVNIDHLHDLEYAEFLMQRQK